MSNVSSASNEHRGNGVTISFGEHFANSEQFDRVFHEGMALVERAASYLDGAGRKESRKLEPSIAVTYATESMRMTTRLLEVASWLLVRKALRNGEITVDEAKAKRARIKLAGTGGTTHIANFDKLPSGLRGLVEASFALNERVLRLDAAMSDTAPANLASIPAVSNGTAPNTQYGRLTLAFSADRTDN